MLPTSKSSSAVGCEPRWAGAIARRKLVRLNDILLLPENEDLIAEVACHEVAHVAVHELYGEGCRPHGPEWSKLVRAAGFQPRLSVAAAGPEPKRRTASAGNVLYEHRCRSCQAMRTVRRPMVHWRCSQCVSAGLSGEAQHHQPARSQEGEDMMREREECPFCNIEQRPIDIRRRSHHRVLGCVSCITRACIADSEAACGDVV